MNSCKLKAGRRWLVALTGGLGCGKTAALNAFQDNGWRVFSSDAYVHELLDRDQAVLLALMDKFGPQSPVFREDGRVDRSALAAIVFDNPDALAWLEALLHPKVKKGWECAAQEGLERPFIAEIPLLFEKNLEKDFDLVVCVACSPSVIQKRWALRGLDQNKAQAITKCQLPLDEKVRLADIVLWNDGSPEWLAHQVRHVAKQFSP